MSYDVGEMIRNILKREGGYVDHPNDRGGPTNFGITQKTLDAISWSNTEDCINYGIPEKVRDIEESHASWIYSKEYYYTPKINELPKIIQPQMFDMSVNHGPRSAIKILQSACRDVWLNVKADGIIGPITIEASRDLVTNQSLAYKRIEYYAEIVANDNSQAVFLKGWLNRAREFI